MLGAIILYTAKLSPKEVAEKLSIRGLYIFGNAKHWEWSLKYIPIFSLIISFLTFIGALVILVFLLLA